MKRFIGVMLSCVMVMSLCACGAVQLDANTSGTVTYRNEHTGVSFSERLTEEETGTVVAILRGKKQEIAILCGIPSCGFSPSISITVDGMTFALAMDKCGMLQNCNTMQYINISDSERETIESIFTTRGGTFPCV